MGRPKKTKEKKDVITKPEKAEVRPDPVVQTTAVQPQDRMLRFRRNPPCPKCDAHPVVCTQRRGDYAAFRCRQCGHRFEVGSAPQAETPIWKRPFTGLLRR